MKRTFCVIAAIAGLLFANIALAQDSKDKKDPVDQKDTEREDTTTHKKKKNHYLSISTDGIHMGMDSTGKNGKKEMVDKERQGRFSNSYALLDLGINLISDNTNYADPSVQSYLKVPAEMRNKSLFDLRTGKSINVNIYPWMLKYMALKTPGQKIYISTGVGLQLYNFRYDEPLTYIKNPPAITLDTIVFKKDKLAIDYLNVPLMVTFKTRISKKKWLTYGVGVTEGYRIGSLNKQVSSARDKVKTRGSFGLADFNTCINAEIGIEGIVRFFASYQLTSMYDNGLDQHPICFGFRLSGI